MSATFIERVIAVGDHGEDGGAIDPVVVHAMLTMFSAGDADATYLKTLWALTTPQGEQLDAVLATMPDVVLSLVTAYERAQWPTKVYSILMLGRMASPDFDTGAKCASALGI